jgi:hypothetical protein
MYVLSFISLSFLFFSSYRYFLFEPKLSYGHASTEDIHTNKPEFQVRLLFIMAASVHVTNPNQLGL